MSRDRLGVTVSATGLLALLLAVAWWWLIFSRVVGNAYMTYPQAAPCLFGTSDLCALAQALCKNDHLLGIRRYSAELLWASLGLIGVGAVLVTGRRA